MNKSISPKNDQVSPLEGRLRGVITAPRIKDLGTRWTKMRRNFELFEEERRVFKIPALRTKRVRSLSSARLFLFLFWGDAKKERLEEEYPICKLPRAAAIIDLPALRLRKQCLLFFGGTKKSG